jgi:hypothetical protein
MAARHGIPAVGSGWRRLAAGVAVLLVAGTAAAPAAAAAASSSSGPGWSITPTPSPLASQAHLSAVSCSSASACTAVGDHYNGAGVQVTLAEVWDGSRWAVQPTPNPAGAGASALRGVSCTSPDACTAVGYAHQGQDRTKLLTLVETWNGKSWKIVPSPSPAGADIQLVAVSCISSAACVAVGSARDYRAPLAETWNGTAWAIHATPLPAGSTGSLSGVSCTAAAACTAVGSQVANGVLKTLAETWNGSAWALQPTPNAAGPRGAQGSALSAISCIPGSTACTAVGYSNSAGNEQVTLAEARTGTHWVIQPTPTPTGSQGIVQGFLTGVSCTSRAACSAAGNHIGDTGYQVPLMEAWNGTAWKIRPAPAARDSTTISGISCPLTGRCTAAGGDSLAKHYARPGDGDTFTLAEAWDGKDWAIQPTPNPAGLLYTSLSAVSCASPAACAAVGYYERADGSSVDFAEIWTGTRWAIKPVPVPPSSGFARLTAVSCPTASHCVAVGVYDSRSSGGRSTMAVIWNGSRWRMTAMPVPSGFTVLSGISCTSPTFCTAVGWDDGPSVGGTLVETWNGSTWAVRPTPNPAGSTGSALTAVSCASATACSAVGNYTTSGSYFLSLAEYWNGSTWKIQPTPNATGTDTYLTGVSCPAAGACTASGYTGGGASTLVEVLNAGTWTVVATPNPGPNDELLAMSCSSATACTAVGQYDSTSGRTLTLAEAWNGSTWAVQPTPSKGSRVTRTRELTGVSCPSASFCMAGGWSIRYYVRLPGVLRALAEHYT